MRLNLAIHPVTEMRFGTRTQLIGTRLEINRDELERHLLEDSRLASVDLETVRPGENCRVGMVFDVLEPRIKEPGSGSDFPGIIGDYALSGHGTTHVLRGAAVTICDDGRKPPHRTSRGASNILEMSGPAAAATPYGKLQHLVVIPHASPDMEWHVYYNALRQASAKAAVYLARAAFGESHESTEVYDLDGPVVEGREGLRRVVFIGQIHSGHHGTEVDENIVYGHNGLGMLPIPMHPNEWLDGALTISYTHNQGGETFFYQNNPIIQALYRKHEAKEITFAGVIAVISPGVDEQRARNCMLAANMAKWLFKTDGVVLSRYYYGQPHSDMFETARQCELLGMKTAVLSADSASDGRVESALLMNLPEVQAVVLNGNGFDIKWQVPTAERVIAGSPEVAAILAPAQEIGVMQQRGVGNQQGASQLLSKVY